MTAHGLVFIIYYSKYIAYHLIILHMKKLKRQTDFNLETIYIHFLAEKKNQTVVFEQLYCVPVIIAFNKLLSNSAA